MLIEPDNFREFFGRFLVIGGLNQKIHVFAKQGDEGHSLIYSRFEDILLGYGLMYDQSRQVVKVLSGGSLQIMPDTVMVFGESLTYGKFDEQIIGPIFERLREQRFPNYKLLIK